MDSPSAPPESTIPKTTVFVPLRPATPSCDRQKRTFETGLHRGANQAKRTRCRMWSASAVFQPPILPVPGQRWARTKSASVANIRSTAEDTRIIAAVRQRQGTAQPAWDRWCRNSDASHHHHHHHIPWIRSSLTLIFSALLA